MIGSFLLHGKFLRSSLFARSHSSKYIALISMCSFAYKLAIRGFLSETYACLSRIDFETLFAFPNFASSALCFGVGIMPFFIAFNVASICLFLRRSRTDLFFFFEEHDNFGSLTSKVMSLFVFSHVSPLSFSDSG